MLIKIYAKISQKFKKMSTFYNFMAIFEITMENGNMTGIGLVICGIAW